MNKQDTLTELAATRFWSPNDYFLQLTTNTKSPTVGQYMIFNVQTNAFIETIYYHVSQIRLSLKAFLTNSKSMCNQLSVVKKFLTHFIYAVLKYSYIS